jgi:hypothetical protein
MSGYAGVTIGSSGILEEGGFFLPKPFSRDSLTSKIREALSFQRSKNESRKAPTEVASPN